MWWRFDQRSGRWVRTATKPAAGGIKSPEPTRVRRGSKRARASNGRVSATPQAAARPGWLLVDDEPSASSAAVEVALIDWRASPVGCRLTSAAREQIIAHANRRGGWTEEGGLLIGLSHRPGEIVVTDAAGPGDNSERTAKSYRPDGEHDEITLRALEQEMGGQVIEVGSFHSHLIAGRTWPSGADLQASAADLERAQARDGRPRTVWLQLLVTPSASAGLARPSITAWATRRDTGRYICERAELS